MDDFTALYAAHSPRVRQYCRRRVDESSCDDVVAQTFLIAWRRRADLPPNPLPWLLVTARQVISEQLRQRTRERDRPPPDWQSLAAASAEVTATERDQALRALAALSETDRELLLLIAWDGLSSAEAAQVLGVSRATFGVRLHRARARLERAAGAPDMPAGAARSRGQINRTDQAGECNANV
ncbi:RNA polymerase subunit sigma-24 [Enemella evansiae]|uniref:RNA polymerase sigma factor n=1 Tax=Enemella evansiae TaxID=2016499 RepID=UPI000B964B5A|nr:RNA polymerase sigma factor [Enemella evansiae]OYO18922.1 RNA polymerase subunit sigma-24 [Enemella evansiae]